MTLLVIIVWVAFALSATKYHFMTKFRNAIYSIKLARWIQVCIFQTLHISLFLNEHVDFFYLERSLKSHTACLATLGDYWRHACVLEKFQLVFKDNSCPPYPSQKITKIVMSHCIIIRTCLIWTIICPTLYPHFLAQRRCSRNICGLFWMGSTSPSACRGGHRGPV